MNLQKPVARPRLIYWIHIAILIPELVIFAYLFIQLLLHPLAQNASAPGQQIITLVIGLIISPLTVVVGLFCIRRAPGNVVGVILAIWGCSIIGIITLDETPWVSGLGTVLAGVIWPATFFLFSYFPDGKIYPSRFEKWLDRIVIFIYLAGIMSGLGYNTAVKRSVPNTFYTPGLEPFQSLFQTVSSAGAFMAIGFGAISLFLRFRSADIATRQQIKWLLWGGFPFILAVSLLPLISAIPALQPLNDIVGYLIQLWLMIIPVVAIGNAILRHRLYDIDIIIRRTLIYSVLTAVLALLYFGGVVLAQAALRPFIGENSEAGIVISTLLSAVLFSPLRRRVQNVIDRRFYRRKYDAERTLAAFNATMRDEVDLDALQAALVKVVQETMQPKSVALWIKEPNQKNS